MSSAAAAKGSRIMTCVDIQKVGDIIRDVAAEEIMPRWRNLASGDISHKSKPGDLVTVADRAAEAVLEQRLSALLPGSLVIGEEAVFATPSVLERFNGSDFIWVLDPIDGTRAFAEGRTTFDVLVALVQNGRGVAGWIYAPAEDDLYFGEACSGVVRAQAGHDEVVLRAPERNGLGDLHGIVNPRVLRDRGVADPERTIGLFRGHTAHTCAGHNYARILRGDSDFLINYSTLPWDHYPGLTLAEAGGWHAARHDGRPFAPLEAKGGILVAPNRDLWSELKSVLLPAVVTAEGA
jgi:fructose-1,6-bisphosphatase/inositol monophosphatase family enzyme